MFFFFNDTATTEIYTLSLHDALPISRSTAMEHDAAAGSEDGRAERVEQGVDERHHHPVLVDEDRKSTRLNSSHANISYAVFCLKKKKTIISILTSLHSNILYSASVST